MIVGWVATGNAPDIEEGVSPKDSDLRAKRLPVPKDNTHPETALITLNPRDKLLARIAQNQDAASLQKKLNKLDLAAEFFVEAFITGCERYLSLTKADLRSFSPEQILEAEKLLRKKTLPAWLFFGNFIPLLVPILGWRSWWGHVSGGDMGEAAYVHGFDSWAIWPASWALKRTYGKEWFPFELLQIYLGKSPRAIGTGPA